MVEKGRNQQDKTSFSQGAEGIEGLALTTSLCLPLWDHIQVSVFTLEAKWGQEPAPPLLVLLALAETRGHGVETGAFTLSPAQRPPTTSSKFPLRAGRHGCSLEWLLWPLCPLRNQAPFEPALLPTRAPPAVYKGPCGKTPAGSRKSCGGKVEFAHPSVHPSVLQL